MVKLLCFISFMLEPPLFYTCTLMFRFLSTFLIVVRTNYTVIILRLNNVLKNTPLPYTIPRRMDNLADTYALFVTL